MTWNKIKINNILVASKSREQAGFVILSSFIGFLDGITFSNYYQILWMDCGFKNVFWLSVVLVIHLTKIKTECSLWNTHFKIDLTVGDNKIENIF